jgi:uncharacterized integral membrane protein
VFTNYTLSISLLEIGKIRTLKGNAMTDTSKGSLRAGMKTSPWIILGSTAILLIVVMVLAFQNTNRERR